MDSTQNNNKNFQNGFLGATPQFHNFLYPTTAKQNFITNIFANHPFQRTFASVVSCNNPTLNFRQSTSKLVNSFLEAVIKQEPQPQPQQREFHDYQKMPNWRNMGCQQKYSRNSRGGCRYRPPNKKFHYSHHYQPDHHHQQQFPQKNRHEKERFNIERDIRNDRCDNFNRFWSRGRGNNNNYQNKSNTCIKSTTETKQSMKSPPFEIYSLEEFPAIVTTTMLPTATNKNSQQSQSQDIDENDFVKFQSDIARTTPTYVQKPIRFNLCDAVTNFVTSPKKLLSLPLSAPKRSCLKATPLKSRTMSECSDDFIVFDYTNGSPSCLSQENVDCESDDDDDDVEEEEEEDDGDENESEEEEVDECDKNYFDNDNFRTDDVQQPDSGIEEKKVHFNAAVKVNFIRAWDYAYREARKGDVWLQLARDRERFNKRIQDCGNLLRPILNENHRRKVFADRFEPKN
ncbi:hypothetical protein PVAND_003715 [Polypedilum vanderplanki]|uniref:Uncharacterized protein n=1 Tax=Polypedilum vanderplanki TaxID=319348 RepID=A0A9J6BUX0_POLVA|nr:hypothetical protein PVAND_003715 [Polypedilum vanderplanki]